ncbi:hypothetical protein LTR84_000833 [Exophiala bonariae]|uniref:Galactose oxidase n=1 Tax=Exophiala bonariae TaxID=1690606 RepID=A0AAV9NVS0_9EURO|nr:hypothetical protein LTR84_000833 [Exophiala bonariae]
MELKSLFSLNIYFCLSALITLNSAAPGATTRISPSDYEWHALPAIPSPRQEQSVVAVGNRVYIIGGITSNFSYTSDTLNEPVELQPVKDVEFYDIEQRSWGSAAPLPVSINHGNVASVGGKIYLLGGLSGANMSTWNNLANSYVYDPSLDTWTEIAPMPEGTARGGAAVGVYGSTIILAGGLTKLDLTGNHDQLSVNFVSSYDTKTNKWSTSFPSLPGARDHVAGAVIGHTFYVTGGRDLGQYNTRNNTWALDLTSPSLSWVEKAPLPTARGGLASVAIRQYLFTFGGEGNTMDPNGVFNNTEVYDTVNDSWLIGPPMSLPRHGTNAVAIGPEIFIPGGGILIAAGPVNASTVYRPKVMW